MFNCKEIIFFHTKLLRSFMGPHLAEAIETIQVEVRYWVFSLPLLNIGISIATLSGGINVDSTGAAAFI